MATKTKEFDNRAQSQAEELRHDNKVLSAQIKQLLKVQHELGFFQDKLKTQNRLYQKLYEVGKQLNTTFEQLEILQLATEFILYELGFERCLIFLPCSTDRRKWCVQTLDGYYEDDEYESMSSLTVAEKASFLKPLHSGQTRIVYTKQDRATKAAKLACATFKMDEYVVYPLRDDEGTLMGFVAAGNTDGNAAYYNAIEPDGEFVVALANMISLLTTVLMNHQVYQRINDERADLENRVQERTRNLEIVAEISEQLTSILDVEQLLQDLVDQVKNRFDFYHAQVYVLDEDQNLIMEAGSGSVGDQMRQSRHLIPLNKPNSLVARAARTQEAVVVDEVQKDPDFLPHPLLPDTRSEMVIPLIAGERVLGVLDVQANTVRRFTPEDVKVQTTLAAQIGVAIENAGLYEQAQESELRLNSLIEYAPEAIVVTDLETGLFIDPNENALKIYGMSREELMKIGAADVSPEYQPDGRSSAEVAMEKMQEALNGGFPVFEWMHRNASGENIPCEIRLVKLPVKGKTLVRATVTDITERKQIEEVLAKQAQELQIVAEISTKMATMLEPETLLQEVVDVTKEQFGLYHAHIYLLNDQQDTLILTSGAGEVGRKLVLENHRIDINIPKSFVAQAARSRQAIVENRVRQSPGFLANPLLPDTQAEMAVPMMIGERVIGVLDVQSDVPDRFSQEDMQIQTTLATQISISLENARSFEQAQTAVSEMNALTRRLTREGWQEYLAEKSTDKVGFVYDPVELNSVLPITESVDDDVAASDEPVDSTDEHQVVRPIHVLGESIGKLSIVPDNVESDNESEFDEIMNAVTQRLSDHLENLRLTEQTQTALSQTEQQAERLSMLNEMGAELSRADMLDEILQIGVDHTAKILVADRVTLGILTPEREHVEFVAAWGEVEPIQSGVIVPIGMNKTMKTAVQENRVILEQKSTLQTFSDMKSFMIAPLAGDNRVIGVINVGNLIPNYFTKQDQSLILQISSLLGAAIERQRLAELTKAALDETQRRSEELALINRVMAAVTGSLDLTKNMQIIARELAQAISVSHVSIALMTEDQNHLEVVTEYPLPKPGSLEDSIGTPLPIKGNPLTEQALETRKFAVAYDAQNNPLTAPIHDIVRKRQIATLAVLPMAMGDEIYGTVGFDLTDPDRMITDEQMRLAETIVYHTTTVVQNARLFAQTEQRLADLMVIQQTVSDLTEANSTQDALESLTPKLMSAVDADSVTIYEINDESLMRLIQYPELSSEFMEGTQIMPLERFEISDEALRSRQPVILSANSPELHPIHVKYLQDAEIVSTALVPLVSQDGVVGLMFANMHQEGKRFSEHDTGLLQTLANQASIALDRIRLLEEARRRARREQLLREIAAKVRSTTQVDSVMRTAVQEVGRALGRKTFLYLDQTADQEQNPDKDV